MTVAGFHNVAAKRDASDSFDAENLASRRPNQAYRFREDYYRARDGGSHYHAGVFKLEARTGHFRMSSWYALSYMKASHDATINDNRSPSHPGALLDSDWGRPSHHRTHNLLLLPSWDLPLLRDRQDLLGGVLGRWTATLIYSARSGTPVDTRALNNSYTCVNCWNRGNRVSGEPTVNPNWRSDPALVYFNSKAIVQPPNGTFGTMKMGELTWTPDQNLDLSLNKGFALHEDVRLELRSDFFNLFNWVSWRDPRDVNVFQAITYGMKNNWTAPAREIQLGLRLVW
jgi:hypothetical protein